MPNTYVLERTDKPSSNWQSFGVALGCCAVVTGVSTLVMERIDLANIVMLYLLSVLLVSVWQGKVAGVFSAVISVLFFDVFFVPPRFSILVEDFQYLITFAVMLVTALITGQLAAGLKEKAKEAVGREENIKALYQAASKLGASLNLDDVHSAMAEFVLRYFGASSVLMLSTKQERVFNMVPNVDSDYVSMPILHSCYFSGDTVRNSTLTGNSLVTYYICLKGIDSNVGVMVVNGDFDDDEATSKIVDQLEGLASLVAIAVERLRYQEAAQSSEVKIEVERLRNAILSSLSHDLRTPLTALVGMSESLLLSNSQLSRAQVDLVNQINLQSKRISELVADLLDLARASSGANALRKDWLPIEETIGSSLRLLTTKLAPFVIKTSIQDGMPLLEIDPVLIERVLCNLLENAANQSEDGAAIEVTAYIEKESAVVSVRDHGRGFTSEQINGYGHQGDQKGGPRLGLLICRTILNAHGGDLIVGNHPDGGAVVKITLPIGNPPKIEEVD